MFEIIAYKQNNAEENLLNIFYMDIFKTSSEIFLKKVCNKRNIR